MAATTKPLNRRGFLGRLSAVAASVWVVPGGVLASAEKAAPSQRVVAALIGCGGRGMGLLSVGKHPNCTVAAVCDVDQRRIAAAQRQLGGCDGYQDFRRILDRRDIDAVLIGTPDHWHAVMTIMACQAGKDVYCEKPLCRTIEEGRRMIQAARRYERIVQMGTQYRSIQRTRQACQCIRNGRLGKVHTVRMTHPPNPVFPSEAPRPVPAELDWDLWLGPAPWAEYHPKRCHFDFRYFMDYGGGAVADNGVHMFSVVSWALGADATGPRYIEATGRVAPNNFYDVPVEMEVRFELAEPACTVLWQQRPGAKLNLEFVGTEATLSGFWEYQITAGKADLTESPNDPVQLERSEDHLGNWLECIATRRRPVMDVEVGHRATCWSHLANIAWLLGRRLQWDPAAERFVSDEQANRLLHYAYRHPWRL